MTAIHTHADEHSDDIVAAPGPEREALKGLNAYQTRGIPETLRPWMRHSISHTRGLSAEKYIAALM